MGDDLELVVCDEDPLPDPKQHPFVLLVFESRISAEQVVETASFCAKNESRQMLAPKGLVVRVLPRQNPMDPHCRLLVAGEILAAQMMEALNTGFDNGAMVEDAGFAGADSDDWIPTFKRACELHLRPDDRMVVSEFLWRLIETDGGDNLSEKTIQPSSSKVKEVAEKSALQSNDDAKEFREDKPKHRIYCSHCGQGMRVAERHFGTTGKCVKCGQPILVSPDAVTEIESPSESRRAREKRSRASGAESSAPEGPTGNTESGAPRGDTAPPSPVTADAGMEAELLKQQMKLLKFPDDVWHEQLALQCVLRKDDPGRERSMRYVMWEIERLKNNPTEETSGRLETMNAEVKKVLGMQKTMERFGQL